MTEKREQWEIRQLIPVTDLMAVVNLGWITKIPARFLAICNVVAIEEGDRLGTKYRTEACPAEIVDGSLLIYGAMSYYRGMCYKDSSWMPEAE